MFGLAEECIRELLTFAGGCRNSWNGEISGGAWQLAIDLPGAFSAACADGDHLVERGQLENPGHRPARADEL